MLKANIINFNFIEREREGDAERYDPYIYNIIAGYFAKYDKVIIVFLSLSIIGGEILEKK